MKTNFVIIVLFLLNFSVSAQSVGILKYNLLNDDMKLGVSTQEKIIYFNGKASVELAGRSFLKQNDKNDETRETIVLPSKKPVYIYKNFSNKSLSLSERVGTKKHVINDTLSNFKWKITNERKKILNYNCVKATTQFRGRKYEAWYTEEIAIQNGPWKFCGLPGLIVKIYDEKLTFVYELTYINLKVKFDERIIAVPKEYKEDKPITYKKFMVLYNKKLAEYDKLSKVVTREPSGSSNSIIVTLPEKMEKF